MMILFLLVDVGVGVGHTYATLCGFLNRSVVSLCDGELAVEHWPLPWPGGVRVRAADVARIFCEMKPGRNSTLTCSVVAVLKAGRNTMGRASTSSRGPTDNGRGERWVRLFDIPTDLLLPPSRPAP